MGEDDTLVLADLSTGLVINTCTVAEARSDLVLTSALRPVEGPVLSKVEGSKDCRRAQPNSAGHG